MLNTKVTLGLFFTFPYLFFVPEGPVGLSHSAMRSGLHRIHVYRSKGKGKRHPRSSWCQCPRSPTATVASVSVMGEQSYRKRKR